MVGIYAKDRTMELKYGDIVRMKMKTKDNKQGHQITTRQLEREITVNGEHYSYEHYRKILNNMPVVSSDLNEALCDYLGLDAAKMWSIAEKEKFQRKFDSAAIAYMPPANPFFKDIWPKLTNVDIEKLRKIADGMATANEAAGLVTARRKRA
jgi:hypothetical protein